MGNGLGRGLVVCLLGASLSLAGCATPGSVNFQNEGAAKLISDETGRLARTTIDLTQEAQRLQGETLKSTEKLRDWLLTDIANLQGSYEDYKQSLNGYYNEKIKGLYQAVSEKKEPDEELKLPPLELSPPPFKEPLLNCQDQEKLTFSVDLSRLKELAEEAQGSLESIQNASADVYANAEAIDGHPLINADKFVPLFRFGEHDRSGYDPEVSKRLRSKAVQETKQFEEVAGAVTGAVRTLAKTAFGLPELGALRPTKLSESTIGPALTNLLGYPVDLTSLLTGIFGSGSIVTVILGWLLKKKDDGLRGVVKSLETGGWPALSTALQVKFGDILKEAIPNELERKKLEKKIDSEKLATEVQDEMKRALELQQAKEGVGKTVEVTLRKVRVELMQVRRMEVAKATIKNLEKPESDKP